MPTQTSRRLRPLALLLALAAVSLAALITLTPGTARADQYCVNLKGQLCITLTPDPDTNPVGTDHTLTAAGTIDGNPLGEATFEVGFAVYDGPNAGQGAVITMGPGGTADFTYTGSGGPGTDNILAVFCDFPAECQSYVDDCAQNGAACVDTITGFCGQQLARVPGGRVSAGRNFCFGPANAVKNWEEPTPTPSPTPVDVGAGGQGPSPTPVQLPDTGGTPGTSGADGAGWILAFAAITALAGAAAIAARRLARSR